MTSVCTAAVVIPSGQHVLARLRRLEQQGRLVRCWFAGALVGVFTIIVRDVTWSGDGGDPVAHVQLHPFDL